jgi:hypothetical protein
VAHLEENVAAAALVLDEDDMRRLAAWTFTRGGVTTAPPPTATVMPSTDGSRQLSMSFQYEVRVRGRLSRTLASEFEELALAARVAPVETVLSGPVEDQAALHGLLRRIESLGLELLEVRRLPANEPG